MEDGAIFRSEGLATLVERMEQKRRRKRTWRKTKIRLPRRTPHVLLCVRGVAAVSNISSAVSPKCVSACAVYAGETV